MSGAAPRPEAEPLWALGLVVAMIFFAGWLLWYFFRIEILVFLRYLRLTELWIISLFTDRVTGCYEWLKQAPIADTTPTNDGMQLTLRCFGDLSALPHGKTVLDYYNLTG